MIETNTPAVRAWIAAANAGDDAGKAAAVREMAAAQNERVSFGRAATLVR